MNINSVLIKILLLFIPILYLNAEDKITLQLSWLHQFQFAGYYMAKEKGFYKNAGIDVDIKEFHYDLDLSTVLENKNADFAIGRSSLLIDKSNGKDIVALGAIFQTSPLMLLVTKESGINNIEDLKNKKIMITSDAKSSASIIAMLNSKGVHLHDLTIQKHSFNINDLISNKTDSMASYISNEPIQLKDKNINYTIFHPEDYGFRFYDDILFTSSEYIKNNPQLTEKFFKATLKGWSYAFENIAETSEIIYKKYNSQNKSLIDFLKEADALKKLVYYEEDSQIGSLNEDVLREIIQTYKVLGLLNKDIDLSSFIYEHNPYQFHSFKLNNLDIVYILIILTLIVLAILTTIIYYSIRGKFLYTNQKLLDEIHKAELKIIDITYIDELTQINNRKSYKKRVNELISEYNRYHHDFTMILFDIDRFKRINDTYGHSTGDKVLVDLAKLISENIRQNDYFFRIGGEEFIVLLSQTNLKDGLVVAESLRKLVETKLNTIPNKVITISLGVTSMIENDTIDSLFNRVDNLTYKAKDKGRNLVCFDENILLENTQ